MGSKDVLTAHIESRDGVCRVALSGELDMSNVFVLSDHLTRSALEDVSAIVLDLKHLTFIDSAGLHAIVEARNHADATGQRLVVTGASRPARYLIELTGTEYLLEDHDPGRARSAVVPTLATVSPIRGSSTQVLDPVQDRDSALMDGIGGGDAGAFVHLFDLHAPNATALAYRLLRRVDLADEVVRETFRAVWRAPERYRPERGTVRSWLLALVHRRAMELAGEEESHGTRGTQAVAGGSEDEPPAHAAATEEAGLAEERGRVRDALAALPSEQRQIIELMYLGRHSQTQISEQMSMSVSEVKSQALLGMRRLHVALVETERSI